MEMGKPMKKAIRKAASFLLALAATASLSVPAFAQDASVTFDGNAREFLFAPGISESPTVLFADFKGVMPGDTLTQKSTVRNDVDNQVKVKIYLRSLGAAEGSQEFLSQMDLTVTQDGDSELFAAPADQTDGLSDWVCLGTFYSGADVDLEVTLAVPETMGDDFQNAAGTLRWEFKAEELPIEPGDPKPPQTGEQLPVWPFLGAGAALLCLLLLIPLAKRKQRQENPNK